jgi:hypothetical protein
MNYQRRVLAAPLRGVRIIKRSLLGKDYLHAWSGPARYDVAWGQRIRDYLKVSLLVQTDEIEFVNGLSGTCQKDI